MENDNLFFAETDFELDRRAQEFIASRRALAKRHRLLMLALICVLGYLGATVFFYNTRNLFILAQPS